MTATLCVHRQTGGVDGVRRDHCGPIGAGYLCYEAPPRARARGGVGLPAEALGGPPPDTSQHTAAPTVDFGPTTRVGKVRGSNKVETGLSPLELQS